MTSTKGTRITKRQISSSMFLSLVGGAGSSVWFLLASPQQILTVFVKNHLGISAAMLGYFIAALNIVSISHLLSIILYNRVKTIKQLWLPFAFIHRSFTFVTAGAAFYVAFGGSRQLAFTMIFISSLMMFLIGSSASSGWWTWIQELVPSQQISRYFGRRSAVAQMCNITIFFLATLFLDVFSSSIFMVYGFIYLAAGIGGILEPVLHIPIPEPDTALPKVERPNMSFSLFFSPLKVKEFRHFCLVAGGTILAVNIANPFFPAYITDPNGLNIPNIWLGIMYVISQTIWVIVVPFWGTVMDKFGKKGVTLFGMMAALSFIGYNFLTDDNYTWLLIIIAVFWGALAPALYEGLNQMMFILAPKRNRTIFIAWYWASLGVISALGPIIGGYIMDHFDNIHYTTAASLALLAVAFLAMDQLEIRNERRFSQLVPRITTPTILKAYFNMPIIAGSRDPRKVNRALQRMEGSPSDLAFEEIVERLDDPDDEVREEAVKALGRIGGASAKRVLIAHLADPNSLVRREAARALGKMGAVDAVPYLIDGLYAEDNTLAEACTKALGRIDDQRAVSALLKLMDEERPLRIKVTGAEAIAGKGHLEALQKILRIRLQTKNPVLEKQLAISLGNMIGTYGEFYQYVSGSEESRDEAVEKFFKDLYRSLKRLKRTDKNFIRHIVRDLLPRAINAYEDEDYVTCFEQLYTIVLNLIYRFIEQSGEDVLDMSPERFSSVLYEKNPRLYAGFSIFQWLDIHKGGGHHEQSTPGASQEQQPAARADSQEKQTFSINRTDILLCFYILRHYSDNSDKQLILANHS